MTVRNVTRKTRVIERNARSIRRAKRVDIIAKDMILERVYLKVTKILLLTTKLKVVEKAMDETRASTMMEQEMKGRCWDRL